MKNSKNKREIGDYGETAVCRFLEQHGAVILKRNFTIRGGEIDIIASYGSYLLFVEVKTRRSNAMVSGAAAVDHRKQQLLLHTAEEYLLRFPTELQPRFDVAEVTYSENQAPHITYLENAFDANS